MNWLLIILDDVTHVFLLAINWIGTIAKSMSFSALGCDALFKIDGLNILAPDTLLQRRNVIGYFAALKQLAIFSDLVMNVRMGISLPPPRINPVIPALDIRSGPYPLS